eukprot:9504184-Pyramimonas_sp.AAC.4
MDHNLRCPSERAARPQGSDQKASKVQPGSRITEPEIGLAIAPRSISRGHCGFALKFKRDLRLRDRQRRSSPAVMKTMVVLMMVTVIVWPRAPASDDDDGGAGDGDADGGVCRPGGADDGR